MWSSGVTVTCLFTSFNTNLCSIAFIKLSSLKILLYHLLALNPWRINLFNFWRTHMSSSLSSFVKFPFSYCYCIFNRWIGRIGCFSLSLLPRTSIHSLLFMQTFILMYLFVDLTEIFNSLTQTHHSYETTDIHIFTNLIIVWQ